MILVGVRPVDSGLVCGCTPGGRALAPAMAPPQFIVTTVKTKQNPQPAPAQLPLPSSQPNLDFYVLESGAPPYLNTATADITNHYQPYNHHRFCDRSKKVE